MPNIEKHLGIAFFALVVILVSSMQVTLNACEEATASSSGSTSISPELDMRLKSLQINDTIFVWIDVQARVDRFGDRYLPADPRLYGINWISISYDPDIEQNNLFWVLAEVKAGTVREISEISWVRNITLIKVGEHERLFENPKFAVKGVEYAILVQ